jgi:hypothetical protein
MHDVSPASTAVLVHDPPFSPSAQPPTGGSVTSVHAYAQPLPPMHVQSPTGSSVNTTQLTMSMVPSVVVQQDEPGNEDPECSATLALPEGSGPAKSGVHQRQWC